MDNKIIKNVESYRFECKDSDKARWRTLASFQSLDEANDFMEAQKAQCAKYNISCQYRIVKRVVMEVIVNEG